MLAAIGNVKGHTDTDLQLVRLDLAEIMGALPCVGNLARYDKSILNSLIPRLFAKEPGYEAIFNSNKSIRLLKRMLPEHAKFLPTI